jgi:uncharacterized protein
MLRGEEGIVRYKKDIIETLLKYLPEAYLYLFGSRAKGKHHETSDIDIAIDNKIKIENKIVFQMKNSIDSLNIPYSIDIVDFNNVSEILKKQIERDKISWN